MIRQPHHLCSTFVGAVREYRKIAQTDGSNDTHICGCVLESQQQILITMNEKFNLVEMAKECPSIIVQIGVDDLINAGRELIASTKNELERELKLRDAITYYTREQVMQILNVSPTTIWRWKQNGQLTPICIGGQYRYKSTDIDKFVEDGRFIEDEKQQ